MKLGAETRTPRIGAAARADVSLFTTGRMLWPSSSSPAPAPVQVATPPGVPPRPAARRSAGGKPMKLAEARLDPTLDLDLLHQTEQMKYAGTGRNIFVAGSLPVAHDSGATDRRKHEAEMHAPPVIPPPPPINLKFFGFASKPGEPKKIFLSQGEDIFVASEGDIVNRRYRILHIAPTSVDVEDVLNNNRQNIPLTQG